MFDVCFRGVLEQLLGVGEYTPTDARTPFIPPETLVLLVGAEVERVICGRGD
jgi:hypothetical protein